MANWTCSVCKKTIKLKSKASHLKSARHKKMAAAATVGDGAVVSTFSGSTKKSDNNSSDKLKLSSIMNKFGPLTIELFNDKLVGWETTMVKTKKKQRDGRMMLKVKYKDMTQLFYKTSSLNSGIPNLWIPTNGWSAKESKGGLLWYIYKAPFRTVDVDKSLSLKNKLKLILPDKKILDVSYLLTKHKTIQQEKAHFELTTFKKKFEGLKKEINKFLDSREIKFMSAYSINKWASDAVSWKWKKEHRQIVTLDPTVQNSATKVKSCYILIKNKKVPASFILSNTYDPIVKVFKNNIPVTLTGNPLYKKTIDLKEETGGKKLTLAEARKKVTLKRLKRTLIAALVKSINYTDKFHEEFLTQAEIERDLKKNGL